MSVRQAEAEREAQERKEKQKRQFEAAKKSAQSDKTAFDPPPAPVPNKSEGRGLFHPLTRQDLDTVSSWSSDLSGMLVPIHAAMETGGFGMQEGEADRFSSLSIRLVAELCARPAQKLVDDLKASKWDGNADELESHVERLLGTSKTSKTVLDFMKDMKDAAGDGTNAWLLHEIASIAEMSDELELPSTLQDKHLAASIMSHCLNRKGCKEPIISAAIGLWYGILYDVVQAAYGWAVASEGLRGLVWGMYEGPYTDDGGNIDEADEHLTEGDAKIDYTLTAAAILSALLTSDDGRASSYILITGMDQYETEAGEGNRRQDRAGGVEKLPLMAALRRAEDAKEVGLRRMAQWTHLDQTAEEVEESEHTDEIRHFLPTLLTSGALKEAHGQIGDRVRDYMVQCKTLDTEEEEESSKRQKTDIPKSMKGKTVSFAGHGFHLFSTKEAAEAAAEKAGAQVISWPHVRWSSRNGAKFWDFFGENPEDPNLDIKLGTLDIVVVTDGTSEWFPGHGQGTETWTEDEFYDAAKA